MVENAEEEFDEFQKLEESIHIDHLSNIHSELYLVHSNEYFLHTFAFLLSKCHTKSLHRLLN